MAVNNDLVLSQNSVAKRPCNNKDGEEEHNVKDTNPNRSHGYSASGSIKKPWNSVLENSSNTTAMSSFGIGLPHSSSHVNEIHHQTLLGNDSSKQEIFSCNLRKARHSKEICINRKRNLQKSLKQIKVASRNNELSQMRQVDRPPNRMAVFINSHRS